MAGWVPGSLRRFFNCATAPEIGVNDYQEECHKKLPSHQVPCRRLDHHAQLRRTVIASTVGTAIEWYDFQLYGQVTGLVFGKLFFPRSDPLVGVLQAFAIYRRRFCGPAHRGGDLWPLRGSDRSKGGADYDLAVDRPCDLCRGLCPDLQAGRHLGRCHPDHYSLHPGSRARRRMGRFSAAFDGMGAVERPPRIYRVLAAIRRASRIFPGQFGSISIQRDLRRPVSQLGMACPVLLSIIMVGVGLYIRLRNTRDPDLFAAAGRKPDRTGTGIRSDKTSAEVDHSGGAG